MKKIRRSKHGKTWRLEMSWKSSEKKETFKEVHHRKYGSHVATRFENAGCDQAKDVAFKIYLCFPAGSTSSLSAQIWQKQRLVLKN